MGFLGPQPVLAAEDAEPVVVVAEETQWQEAASAAVAELRATLRARHMIAARRAGNVRLKIKNCHHNMVEIAATVKKNKKKKKKKCLFV